MTEMNWYIVQTYSNYENKAKLAMEQRIKEANMAEEIEEIFIPTEIVVEVRNGKRREVKRKFYNGYIFVKMVLNDNTWHLVKNTPKVVGFVGNQKTPSPVPESEVKQITQRIEEGKLTPTTTFNYERGQKVRIIEGHFKDFTGFIEEVDDEKQKLTVMVEIFNRPTRKPFSFTDVEATDE